MRAGSMPPMTSTTTSARVTSSSASRGEQRRVDAGAPSGPCRRGAPRCRRSPAAGPTRAARSSALSVSMRATAVPTTPQPSRATRSGRLSLSLTLAPPPGPAPGNRCHPARCPRAELPLFRHPDPDRRGPPQPGRPPAHQSTSRPSRSSIVSRRTMTRATPVPDGDHRRARDVVVLAGQAPAVGARAGDGEEVAGGDVRRQELVLDDDVAALAVLADDAGERRRLRR